MYDRVARREKKLAPLRQLLVRDVAGRVLEVGCGTGLNFEHFRWDQIAALTASDPDPYMLQKAVEKVASLLPPAQGKIQFSDAPAELLPFANQEFDAVVVSLALCTVSDLRRSMAEIERVLRPGGTLHLMEHVRGNGLVGTLQSVLDPLWGRLAAGCHLTRETEAAVRDAGLAVEVRQRFRLNPLLPGFLGTATKPGPGA